MTITIDEVKLAAALNARVDVPYVPEAAEAKAFLMGIEAAIQALIDVSKGVASLAEFGVTVE